MDGGERSGDAGKRTKLLDGWFTVAQAFGQDPYELQVRWTNRQYLTALAWLEQQWNRASRSDHYLMAVAQAVYRIPAILFGGRKSIEEVKLEDMKLEFKDLRLSPKPQMTIEEYSAKAKARWFTFLGINRRSKDDRD